jgi:hypothetical protein
LDLILGCSAEDFVLVHCYKYHAFANALKGARELVGYDCRDEVLGNIGEVKKEGRTDVSSLLSREL